MTIEELIEKLFELQKVAISDNKSLCDDILNCIFNNDNHLGDKVRPYIIDRHEDLESNTNWLFEEILELIKKLK